MTRSTMSTATRSDGGRGPTARSYDVFLGDLHVLELFEEPGPLMSCAAPPPDGQLPPRHPFLRASSRHGRYEYALYQLAWGAPDFDAFCARLRSAGYRVVPREGGGAPSTGG